MAGLLTPRARRWFEWGVLVALVLYAVSLALNARRGTARRPLLSRSLGAMASPALKAATAARDGVVRLVTNQTQGNDLRRANDRLRLENERLRLELATANDLADRLRLMAGGLAAQSLGDRYRLVLAEVIGRGRANGSSGLLIGRGARDGLERGLPVVRGDALVGVVTETFGASARVRLLTDPNSMVTAVIENNRARGVVRGLGLDAQLEYMPELQVRQFPLPAEIVTSGLSGSLFPAGLRVGAILGRRTNEYGQSVAVVKPAAPFSTLEEVVVLVLQDRVTTGPVKVGLSDTQAP